MIGQAELYPVWVARQHWRHELLGRRVVVYIDNDSARYGLVRADSPVPASREIIDAIVAVDREFPCVPWYARCPGPSNIADGPSRLRFVEVASLPGARRVHPAALHPTAAGLTQSRAALGPGAEPRGDG